MQNFLLEVQMGKLWIKDIHPIRRVQSSNDQNKYQDI